ncbi:unnamed protein product [Zymoseptoria tritici ST99CH_1A5]|uniref:Myb/SANT-like domain-containing protein n=1 Tax=Zymoseptoria tritici ST99CH_1A5 TaxID=1276529 RepID=A0A1Y6LXY0_ZYMTR|nr:unnamed protein product [Zymoseptoria tritici ST99CH_1A5]
MLILPKRKRLAKPSKPRKTRDPEVAKAKREAKAAAKAKKDARNKAIAAYPELVEYKDKQIEFMLELFKERKLVQTDGKNYTLQTFNKCAAIIADHFKVKIKGSSLKSKWQKLKKKWKVWIIYTNYISS